MHLAPGDAAKKLWNSTTKQRTTTRNVQNKHNTTVFKLPNNSITLDLNGAQLVQLQKQQLTWFADGNTDTPIWHVQSALTLMKQSQLASTHADAYSAQSSEILSTVGGRLTEIG